MALVFTALTPNTPDLLEDFGTDTSSPIVQAMKTLEGELYFSKPDTIVVLTTHGAEVSELVNVNINSRLVIDWPEGVSIKKDAFVGDVELIAHMNGAVDAGGDVVPMTIIAPSKVPVEAGIPLLYLLDHLDDVKVIIISMAELEIQDHVAFGRFLHNEFVQSNKRVAVIATGHFGNISHPEQATFHHLVQKSIQDTDLAHMLSINSDIVEKADTDIMKPLAVMVGLLETVHIRAEILSQEVCSGKDCIVTNFVIQ